MTSETLTASEVCKIRVRGQCHSLMDLSRVGCIKYENMVWTAATVANEEMLWRGCNWAANFAS